MCESVHSGLCICVFVSLNVCVSTCMCISPYISVWVWERLDFSFISHSFLNQFYSLAKLIPWTRAGITGDSQICISVQQPQTQCVDQERYSAHLNETFLGSRPLDLDIFSQTRTSRPLRILHKCVCVSYTMVWLYIICLSFLRGATYIRARIEAHAWEQFKCSNIYTRSQWNNLVDFVWSIRDIGLDAKTVFPSWRR